MNPNNICIIMADAEDEVIPSTFKVKLLDFLKIKELGEIAFAKVSQLNLINDRREEYQWKRF